MEGVTGWELATGVAVESGGVVLLPVAHIAASAWGLAHRSHYRCQSRRSSGAARGMRAVDRSRKSRQAAYGALYGLFAHRRGGLPARPGGYCVNYATNAIVLENVLYVNNISPIDASAPK